MAVIYKCDECGSTVESVTTGATLTSILAWSGKTAKIDFTVNEEVQLCRRCFYRAALEVIERFIEEELEVIT